MYAIIEASGKQFRAEPDATLRVPLLNAEPGETVTFEVLLAGANGETRVGKPSVSGASVAAEVVRHGKDDKIVVFKRKRRKGYRRKQGHRQRFTEVRIVDIDLGGAAPAKAKKTAKKKPAAEKAAPAEPVAEKPTVEPEAEVVAAEPTDTAPVVTDAARKLAEAHGIDPTTIEGTGQGGRVLKGDVQKAIDAQAEESEG